MAAGRPLRGKGRIELLIRHGCLPSRWHASAGLYQQRSSPFCFLGSPSPTALDLHGRKLSPILETYFLLEVREPKPVSSGLFGEPYISSSMTRRFARRGRWEITTLARRSLRSAMMASLSKVLAAISTSKANLLMSGGMPTVSKRCPGSSSNKV
jgi:hypothetical protein